MQRGLGIIQHGFRVLFVIVFRFVLFFILKSCVEILNVLLPFYSSLYNFTFSPCLLMSEGPLFPCCWDSRLGLQRAGSAQSVFPEAVFQHVITGVVCHSVFLWGFCVSSGMLAVGRVWVCFSLCMVFFL